MYYKIIDPDNNQNIYIPEFRNINNLILNNKSTLALIELSNVENKYKGKEKNNFYYYLYKAKANAAAGKYYEALAVCNLGIKSGFSLIEIYNQKSMIYYQMKDYYQTIASCNQSINAGKANIITFRTKALALKNIDKFAEAIEVCNQAINNDLLFDKVFLSIKAKIQLILEKYAETIETCEQAIKAFPEETEFFKDICALKAKALAHIGKFNEAENIYKDLLSKNKIKTEYLIDFFELYLAMGKIKKAKSVFFKIQTHERASFVDKFQLNNFNTPSHFNKRRNIRLEISNDELNNILNKYFIAFRIDDSGYVYTYYNNYLIKILFSFKEKKLITLIKLYKLSK